jgi:hypothetical protein
MKTRTSIIQLWVGSTRDASAVTMSLSIPFSSGSGGNSKMYICNLSPLL